MAKSTAEVIKLLAVSVQESEEGGTHYRGVWNHSRTKFYPDACVPDCPVCLRDQRREEAKRAFDEWAAVPENKAALAALE